LAEDHAHAKQLAEALAVMPGIGLDPARVQTNIVIAEVTSMPAAEFCRRAAERGVLMAPVGPRHVRAVTHLDVDARGIERAIEVVRGVLTR
jgi:threonine aldolase